MKSFGLFASALILAGVAGSAQASLVIDSFSTDAFTLAQSTLNTAVNKHQTGIPTTQVIGGSRDTTLTVLAGNGSRQAIVEVDNTDSTINISNATGVRSTTVLLYNNNNAANGLGGINLTSFGTGIAFDLVAVDLTVSITIELTGVNATSSLTKSNLTEGTTRFLFNDFSAPAVAGSVNVIKVTFNAPLNADLTGSFLRVEGAAVPEPSTVAALASGAIFMGGVALRRRRSAKA